MKIYVMTKSDETVSVLDNSISGALHYFDDEFHRYLESGASTFDLSIAKKHMMYSNASTGAEDDFQYLKENHFLVFTYKNRDYKFTIRRVEETESSLRLFCEDLSFDLLNEYRGPYKADKAYSIAKYVNDCLVDSGYEIGINEFTKNERTLEWEGDQTVLKRLLSICNSFEAEIEFETILNGDRTVDKQLVHLRKRVGMDRPDIELKYGRDVSSIRRNVDVTELITAIKPRGHEEDNKVVTIKNVEKEIKDEDGNIVFYTKKGSEYIYAPMANQEYGRPEKDGGGHIVGQFSYDTKSDTELFNRALTELEKKCVPAYEFEIEGFYDIDIGDTIRAIDEGYNPILLLEARISEQVISFSDPTKNKTVYSNYRILQNKVSQSLLDRIDEVKKYAEQVAKTYIFSLSNVGSPMFKNGEGEVIFTAKIEKNNQDFTAEFTSYNWLKQNKDGTQDEDWNAAHKNIGKSITVTPSDFEDTATFSYEALQDGLAVGGASGVVTKVYDGEDGKTPIKGVDYFDGQDGTNGLSAYLHIRYSQNSNGNPMTENPVNAKYIGVQASQNPNPSTVPADYMWAEFKGQDGIPGETGADGKTSYLHIKYSNDGGQTFTGNGGEDAGSWMGQYVDFMQADSTDVKKYAWSKIKGDDGQDGVAGKDGVGLKATVIQYAQSTSGTTAPTSGWTTQVPTLIKGQYLWTKTVWTYTDETNETGYTVSYNAKDGNDGEDGIAGKDGVGIKSTKVEYASNTSGTTKPTSGWATTIPSVPSGQFLWTRTTWTYDDNTTEQGFSVAKMGDTGPKGETGAKGDKGDPGNQGIPGTPGADGKTPYAHYAYAWSADGTDRFTDTYPNENLLSTGIVIEKSWINTDGSIQELANGFITDFIPVSYGDIFTLTQVDTQATVGAVALYDTDKQFLSRAFSSNESIFNFKINNASAAYMRITEKSSTGTLKKGIKLEVGDKQTIYTPSPSDDFENAYPTYSGTYTDYTAQDSQNPADYVWTRILGESGQDGKDGVAGKDGVGIKSTAVTYALSDSGTTAPTSGWTANVPTLTKGKYLWTKSVWTYTDNSTETGYSVTYVAKDGNNGSDGLPGKDGVGIKSTAITYAVSSSGTTAPSSGWVASPPTAAAGQYLWTKTVWTYTDNSTETGYSVGKMGTNGSQGPAGNGIASTAITYQASTSGTTAPTGTWSTTIPSVPAGQFLWTKTVTTYTNNNNSTAYTVAKMGSDGKPGSAGVSVSSVVEEYYVSTSPTSQAGGRWSTTVPNNADPNKYVFRRMKTTMSNGTVTYTNPALIQGMTGIYPYIGPTQPANPKENQQWWKSDSSGNVTNFYVYKSSSWKEQTIQQSVLNIIELNAVRILGSTITGTTINTSILNNSGTYQDSGATIIYNSTYNGNITSDWAVENSTQNGTFILSPRNLAAISYTDAARKNPSWHWIIDNNGIDVGNPSYSAIYGGEGITIYNAQLSPTYGRVKLEFQDLMTMPATLIPASSGFSQYAISGDNAPLVSRQGRVVQLSGAFKNNAVLESGASGTMGTLPVWARPERAVLMRVQASYNNTYLLTVNTNGTITMSRHAAGENNVSVPAGSWLNIAIVYAAANL